MGPCLTPSVVDVHVLLPPQAYIAPLTTVVRCRFWRFYSGCGAVAWNVRVRLVKEGCENLSYAPGMAYRHKWEQFEASPIPFHLPLYPEELFLGFARSDKKSLTGVYGKPMNAN